LLTTKYARTSDALLVLLCQSRGHRVDASGNENGDDE
jgi:hypothetical protein